MSATIIKSLEGARKLLKKVSTKRANVIYRTRLLDEAGREVGVFPGNDLPELVLAPGRYRFSCYGTKEETGEVEEAEVSADLLIEPPPVEEVPELAGAAVPESMEWQGQPIFFLAERERVRAETDAKARVQTMTEFYQNMQAIAIEANERADRRIAEANAENNKTLRAWGQPVQPTVVPDTPPEQSAGLMGFIDRFVDSHGDLLLAALPAVLENLSRAGQATVVNGAAQGVSPGVNHGDS